MKIEFVRAINSNLSNRIKGALLYIVFCHVVRIMIKSQAAFCSLALTVLRIPPKSLVFLFCYFVINLRPQIFRPLRD